MAISNHPFEFKTRYRDLRDAVKNPIEVQLLEERDRDLEDFLATVGGGGGVATALRRTTTESHNTSTGYNIDFNVTDYEAGAHASGGTIIIDTPGVWHCTTSWHYNFAAAGGSGVVQIAAGSQGVATNMSSDTDGFGNFVGLCNLSIDALLEAGDIVSSGPHWEGGEVGGIIAVSGCYSVLRLSAHLVG